MAVTGKTGKRGGKGAGRSRTVTRGKSAPKAKPAASGRRSAAATRLRRPGTPDGTAPTGTGKTTRDTAQKMTADTAPAQQRPAPPKDAPRLFWLPLPGADPAAGPQLFEGAAAPQPHDHAAAAGALADGAPVLVLWPALADWIAAALADADRPETALETTLADWQAGAEALLALYRRKRRQVILADMARLRQGDAAAAERIAARLGLHPAAAAQDAGTPDRDAADRADVAAALAGAALAADPKLRAVTEELDASSVTTPGQQAAPAAAILALHRLLARPAEPPDSGREAALAAELVSERALKQAAEAELRAERRQHLAASSQIAQIRETAARDKRRLTALETETGMLRTQMMALHAERDRFRDELERRSLPNDREQIATQLEQTRSELEAMQAERARQQDELMQTRIFRAQLEDANAQLEALRAELIHRQRISNELEDVQVRLAGASTDTGTKEEEIARLTRELKKKVDEIRAWQDRETELLQSTSWRITAPLRAVRTRIIPPKR